jgi:hypothetical protein
VDVTDEMNRNIYESLRDKDIRDMNDEEFSFVLDYLLKMGVF